MGPTLIFDKSTLQSLSPDEAAMLDNFYISNLTPLFFIETLADLEKAVRKGQNAEHMVGSIAYKTPDSGVVPNVHHNSLLLSELVGGEQIDMRFGRPIIARGKATTLEDRTGIIFEQSPEEEALHRWQKKEFLEIERLIAKTWRRSLKAYDLERYSGYFNSLFRLKGKPTSLSAAKRLSQEYIDNSDQRQMLTLGLYLVGISEKWIATIIRRWEDIKRPTISEFAPYFRFIFEVDLFFNIAIAANLVSPERSSNRIDFAYLYYLPFCMVFTSSDKLHALTVPLFTKGEQSFIWGNDLKTDLCKLDVYFSSLPEETKSQGLMKFASYPPDDPSFLTTRLWDEYLPKWRENKANPIMPKSKRAQEEIAKSIDRYYKDATPVDDAGSRLNSDDVHHMIFRRNVYAKKGKWRRFPPEVNGTNEGLEVNDDRKR